MGFFSRKPARSQQGASKEFASIEQRTSKREAGRQQPGSRKSAGLWSNTAVFRSAFFGFQRPEPMENRTITDG